MKLSNAIFPALAQLGKVAIPMYPREQLEGGIVHIGVGNFHRSHQAGYMEDLFNKDFENSKQWGIVGSGVFDSDKRDKLKAQDWLQVLVEQDADSAKAQVLGCMIDYLPTDKVVLAESLAQPQVKIVSLTVTEGGYFLNDGKFDLQADDIQHDVQNPDEPKTVFGSITLGLKTRKEKGIDPFTIMSCDNVPHNGDVVKSVVIGLAEAQDEELAKWIEDNVTFPNGMVDRITPGSCEEQKDFVKKEYDIEDDLPVFCEPFRQWVLEDNFCAGRPALDQLDNVKFVDDVTPYEFMKIRILNGGHASLCYPSALLGLKFVHDAMEHETVGPFLDMLEKKEIIPTVGRVPDIDLQDYWKTIAERFSNPTIEDTIRRNCFDGSSRQPKFIVPVIKDNLKEDQCVDGLALVSAMWCRYCQGTTEAGEEIEPNAPNWDSLNELAKKAVDEPEVWTGMADVYGSETGKDPVFVEAFTKALNNIMENGVEAAMKDYIESQKD